MATSASTTAATVTPAAYPLAPTSRGSRAGTSSSPAPLHIEINPLMLQHSAAAEAATDCHPHGDHHPHPRHEDKDRLHRLESLKSIIYSDGSSPAHAVHGAPLPLQDCVLMCELGRLIRNMKLKGGGSNDSIDDTDDANARLEQIRKLMVRSFSTIPQPLSPASSQKQQQQQQQQQKRHAAHRQGSSSESSVFSTGYLPKTYSGRLIYLACLADNHTWSPFEEYQVEAFKNAVISSRRAAHWLALQVSWPVLTLFALGSYFWLLTDSKHVKMDPLAALILVTTLSAIVTLLGSIYSWYVTGIFPDRSSNAQNLRQNATIDLKECFDELSYELLDLYKVHRSQARLLALLIDIDLIKYRAKRVGADEWDMKKVFRLFESSLEFVRNGTLPRHHLLLHYIVAPTHEGDVEGIGGRGRSDSVGANISNVIHRYLPMSSSVDDDPTFAFDDVASSSSTTGGNHYHHPHQQQQQHRRQSLRTPSPPPQQPQQQQQPQYRRESLQKQSHDSSNST